MNSIPEFKSEAARQAYWKKQRLIELKLDDENDKKISKAYHDVDFGVIPMPKDTRSIKEIEEDTTLQMVNAKKNAMIMMNNDGQEADKLLEMIGKPNYAVFNRFALDIIEKLRNQIGKIRAIEAFKEIGLYIALQTNPAQRIPPSAEQLSDLMVSISNRFDESNSIAYDILQKLDAYKRILEMGRVPPNTQIPMTDVDFDDALSAISDLNSDDDRVITVLEKSTDEISIDTMTLLMNSIENPNWGVQPWEIEGEQKADPDNGNSAFRERLANLYSTDGEGENMRQMMRAAAMYGDALQYIKQELNDSANVTIPRGDGRTVDPASLLLEKYRFVKGIATGDDSIMSNITIDEIAEDISRPVYQDVIDFYKTQRRKVKKGSGVRRRRHR